jgi:hypothetical protein
LECESKQGEAMTTQLAHIIAQANIKRLSLIGLSKNVGKTTTTNHLLETLVAERLYRVDQLALTSLGLDGEAVDALTGLPKPRYIPQEGLLVATTVDLLREGEARGIEAERLLQLPGRTALGPVVIARVRRAGQLVISGPAQLREVRFALEQFSVYGAHLSIVDGAINRLGAAAPAVTDACILCTGTSAGATPEQVARRTADVLARLTIPASRWSNACKNSFPPARLLMFSPSDAASAEICQLDSTEPAAEAAWITGTMHRHPDAVFLLRGALTEELARALLSQLTATPASCSTELVVGDGTKVFCHSAVLQRLAARGLTVRVAEPVRVLALTINPYTPEYICTSRQLLETLITMLPADHPVIIDVVAGIASL